jgi:hypothetical protein
MVDSKKCIHVPIAEIRRRPLGLLKKLPCRMPKPEDSVILAYSLPRLTGQQAAQPGLPHRRHR